jgi:hypothetical protein
MNVQPTHCLARTPPFIEGSKPKRRLLTGMNIFLTYSCFNCILENWIRVGPFPFPFKTSGDPNTVFSCIQHIIGQRYGVLGHVSM